MVGYWNDEAATRACYAGDWLLTGDIVTRDAEGYYWYKGRPEDLIQTADGLIGAAEIEDVFVRHPAIAVAAAIGVPAGSTAQRIKVFLQPKTGVTIDASTEADINRFARSELPAGHVPEAIVFSDALPLTATSKVARRVLRERESARS